jgi:hypothetical protein
MAEERWQPVPIDRFVDLYGVSNLGRVRRTGSTDGRELAFEANPADTLTVRLSASGRPQRLTVARLVTHAFLPRMPGSRPVIGYRDRDRSNCTAPNLV